MTTLDVHRVTHGGKWFGTQFWCRTTYLPVLYGVDTNCAAPCPLCGGRRCGLSVVGNRIRKGLIKLEDKGINQDPIPYVEQLELANVPTEAWIIDPDVHGLLDSLFGTMFHSLHI